MFDQSLLNLSGVGEKLQETFSEMGIETINDLLFYFPNRYDVYEVKPLSELIHDDKVTIEGEVVHKPSLTFYGRKKSRLTFQVKVENIVIKAVVFNRAFAKNQINAGDTITLTGKWDHHRLQITVSNYILGQMNQSSEIQPIYGLKGELSNAKLRKIMRIALNQYGSMVDEILPTEYLNAYKLPSRSDALVHMHFPETHQQLKHARRRFTYEEFLLFQLKIQLLRKHKREAAAGNEQKFQAEKVEEFIDVLPFTLTNAQEKSLKEILQDIKSPYRMNRLLQGDVGSGKTAVAAISMYASITAGKQAALMVPTEVLAEQHVGSLQKTFEGYATVSLLTGSVKGKKRKEILQKVAIGEIDILVGTHALIQDEVQFSNLGLVIVDEQHRFGVEQRRALKDKGLNPDVLFMTATPIPRTLAITAFGDMDVSVIDEMPAGRKFVKTYWAKQNTFDRVIQFVLKELKKGNQTYFICPLIEESDKLDIQNAIDLHQQLRSFFEPDFKVGLMHGRLSTVEKEQVMKNFAENEIQVLVSTTVVEVGVNVPNATVMVIYDAERFGLSQLHQLRGRVGRGNAQSYCILLADPKSEIGKERMRIMTETTDGFALSEQDLKLRGPGDFFGRKQSGMPEFKVADMIHDYRALETARNDAQVMIAENRLAEEAYRGLKIKLEEEDVFSGQVLD
ncbi:ATP-dependent DNA helicase RecG [Aquibacillus sp. 3ASR75-11]|uniref:ATP-dependent DNA helicase RecG n=1 Tax=Terrihalobacillus insolitus TaxID=2950438 RepID=A0A9X3WQW6_9BACI|nr:ATP-dependent DNA helicase RecG [Terrihalobacillus insolitus]MDC3423615.1 ATP-dependent DNA helicase RecG [Terrihalobacillus insolitus]